MSLITFQRHLSCHNVDVGKILIGVSAWADQGLVTSGFYPAEAKTPASRLRYYGGRFSLTEIDASYHYFPTRGNMALWLENSPAGFTFDVRAFSLFSRHPTPYRALPRSIREKYGDKIKQEGNLYQHHLPPEALDDLWEIYGNTLETFDKAGKLGLVFFQFPPWFHPTLENRDYVKVCRQRLARYRLAFEFRVGAWLDEKNRESTLNFLREREVALVCVDEPQGFRSSLPPLAEVTASFALVRFHGRNRETWEAKDIDIEDKFKYLYSEAELAEWLPRVRDMATKTNELHIIFKNKYADYPVRNAQQFAGMLGLKELATTS